MKRSALAGLLALSLGGCASGGWSEPAAPGVGASRTPLEAAKRSVPITMYMTTWCPVCQQAGQYLSARGYDVRELDVEQDMRAAAEMVYVNPRGAVPMFEIDGQYAIGFSRAGLEDMVTEAARRRMATSLPPSSSRGPGASTPR